MTTGFVCRAALATLVAWFAPALAVAQESGSELRVAIDRLGDFDHASRVAASRAIRRTDPALAVPLLARAVRSHADSYVQFRAIVLAYGLDPPRASAIFEEVLDAENDRLRAAAYEYFEQFPSAKPMPALAAALATETSEFVRPALVRALVANPANKGIRAQLVQDIDRGEAVFRSAVIEALGDYGGDYAVDALLRIAGEDGPLQDDALLALGKIGDARAWPTLLDVQAGAPDRLQPVISAALCLLDVDCGQQMRYVMDSLRHAAQVGGTDAAARLRGAAAGIAALATAGHRDAVKVLLEVGVAAPAAARGPVTLALGTVALRAPEIVVSVLTEASRESTPEPELLLLRDAFDMLDEDFAEERFYVRLRGGYWASSRGSAEQGLAEAAMRILEF